MRHGRSPARALTQHHLGEKNSACPARLTSSRTRTGAPRERGVPACGDGTRGLSGESESWRTFSKAVPIAYAKTRAVHENAEASKGRGLVLRMRGLSKRFSCERRMPSLCRLVIGA